MFHKQSNAPGDMERRAKLVRTMAWGNRCRLWTACFDLSSFGILLASLMTIFEQVFPEMKRISYSIAIYVTDRCKPEYILNPGITPNFVESFIIFVSLMLNI